LPFRKASGKEAPASGKPAAVMMLFASTPRNQRMTHRAPEKTWRLDGKRAFAKSPSKSVSARARRARQPSPNYRSICSPNKKLRLRGGNGFPSARHSRRTHRHENILVKIPGEKPGIILLGTHYDTSASPTLSAPTTSGSSTG